MFALRVSRPNSVFLVPMDPFDLEAPLQVPLQQALNASASPTHHILAGSFRSISLFLLAFSPVQLTLDLVQTIPAFGPHQYIGLGPHTQGGDVRHAYTTSWALPPQLQSWAIEQQPDGLRVRFVDSVDISASRSILHHHRTKIMFLSRYLVLHHCPPTVLVHLFRWRSVRSGARAASRRRPWIRVACSGNILCTPV
jgi:hypothetical protein